ncbi:RNA-directed DNA polymerase from mobile element jockey [Nymphon striatum]|nr:RNA-directed DNA polymerase from mobile element jockey [Nymphon striatum]
MATKTPHPLKRTRSQSDIESLNDLNSISQKLPKKLNRKEADDNSSKNNNLISDTNWPRFLVIHQSKGETTKSLSNLSPFAVNKVIISLGGEPKSVKKLFSGDILVETQSKLHTLKLLKSKLFFDIPVTVTPHNSLNYSKGVIRSRELKDCSEEELLTELADQGVTAVKKIILSKNNKKITTGTIIFTFNTPEPPKSIKAAYLNIKVERYIPNPLRCFKCQKFGHHQTSCKGEAACGKCGGANHSDDSCENAPLCLNCKGAHPSFSRECPNFILEKQVVTYKYNFNTTFPEARKIVLSRTSTKSYAHVTAGNVKKDASTQTDHSWHNPSQKTDSTAQTQTENIDKQTIKKPQSNKNKQSETDIKHSNKNKTDKKKESAIPTPNKNTNVKTKIKTYERVIKPLTPTQLKTSTESIDFPPMDVIRSAAESQETTSDNGMEVVIPENSPKDLSAGTYSALDLTLCHPSLFQDFTWMVDGDLHTSDHFPIHVKGNGPPIKGRPQRWKLHRADWTMFKQLCAEQLNISSFAEISDQYSEFITILLEVADISIPKTSQYPKRFNKPWFNKDCKDAVREPQLQSSIKSAWDRLRKIRGKGTSDAYKHLNVGGTAITSQLGIANALGQSFCRNSSSDNCTGSFRSYKNRVEKHQLDFKTTNTEVYNQVFSLEELRRSLRASKDTSPGPDSIHYQMLKHLPDCSLALMLNIFNTIWITGAVPSSWLEATVIPIPKPGKDHTDPSNYRPIALTSCICKTMERMINCRLTYFLESNNILTKYQSGFRRHRSTIDHLVKFETLVREAFVRREHLAAVFFDLEKAYETTWKYGILRDLFNSGLRGRMPIFINHFLTNRKFRVRVGTTFSDHFDLEMGVPQGSILSVTLFSLKINDIVNHVKSGTQCFLYVDDLVSKWDGEINNKLHAIKPKLGEWALAYRKSRKEESILCRLRVGHTYLTHSFLLRNEAQPVCGRCQQPLTPIFGADGTIKPLPLPLPLDLSAGTYSALDLTLCHPSLFQDFTWMVDGDLHTSDHFPIHVKGNGPPIKGRPQRWKLHKADWTMFKQLCAEQLNISSFAEISDQYSEFITILLEVADISIPKTSQYPKRFDKPWFNTDCKDAVRERKRLLRKFSLRPTSDNLSCYRQAAAAARRTIRQAKRESWRQYVSKLNSQSSIKSAWDRLRKIRGKGTSDAYKHLNVGGTAITSQLGIANALGQSFCRNSSSDNCTGSFRSYKNRAESQQLDFKTTNTEVYNQVFSLEELRRSLRASKDTSPGPDSIHYQMLKHLPDCSLALILNIFNTIWITGAIPSSWLEATVIPIPKPGKDHTDPLNYRPIALTSCICKTMERMINCRLTYYLETNNILTRYQSGFRRQRSTIDHLVRFETLVREAFVRREHLAAVFFDLEKAYETTWNHVGISGNEKADFAAKSALSLPSKWDGEINNKLHAIKPKLGEWALAYRKSRKEESILCRLRVGHTYLTHSFLLRNEAQPVCGRCQLQLTVRHVLVDCAALTSVRSRFYSPPPWEEFFQEVDICKIFDFLKYLNVYNRL